MITSFILQHFIEQMAIAPLKLQKQKDVIFRNIKEILVVHKNHLQPEIQKLEEADDIARVLMKSVLKCNLFC